MPKMIESTSAPVFVLADDPIEGDCVFKLAEDFHKKHGWLICKDVGEQFAIWFERCADRFPLGTRFTLVASEPEAQ